VQSGKGTQADIQQLAAMSAATVSSLPGPQMLMLFARMLPALGLASC